MDIAILCPGPSLSHFDGPDAYESIIGVNRAATMFRCDVWAAGDIPLIDKVRADVIGSPTLYTSANAAAILRGNREAWNGPVEEFESLYDGSEHTLQWPMFTATAALWLAASRGASRIRTFGADWKGTKDVDGVEAGMNRSIARWELESGIWLRLTEILASRNVVVERVSK